MVGKKIGVKKKKKNYFNFFFFYFLFHLSNESLAIVVFSPNPSMGSFFKVSTSLSSLGWPYTSANVRDLFNKISYSVNQTLQLEIAPNSCSMVKLSK